MLARRLKTLGIGSMMFALCACPKLDSVTGASTTPTFQAVMITASLSGGATGLPIDVKSVAPTNYTGALCPATSLKLMNHSHDYDLQFGTGSTALVITNNCTAGIWAAICQASGSGGTSTGLPTCATDPRKSSSSQLYITRLGSTPQPVGQTGVNLTVVIQYCSTTTTFNLGSVSSANSTDCVPQ